MPRRIIVNTKPVLLRDHQALLLVKKRAKAEGRSASNAAAQSIIERLGASETEESKPQQSCQF